MEPLQMIQNDSKLNISNFDKIFNLDENFNFFEILKQINIVNLSSVQLLSIFILTLIGVCIVRSYIFSILIAVIAFEIIICRIYKINSPLNILIFGEFKTDYENELP